MTQVLILMIDRMFNDLYVFVKLGLIIVLGFTTSFIGLEWVGATRLSSEALADLDKDVDDMGYGTSFGFQLPGHFFSQEDELKPALFVPLWGFLGEVGPLDAFNTVGDLWMWMYIFLTTVVLVNLLVAMMADTYSRVRENSQTEALAATMFPSYHPHDPGAHPQVT